MNKFIMSRNADDATMVITIKITRKWVKRIKVIATVIALGFCFWAGHQASAYSTSIQDNKEINKVQEMMKNREADWDEEMHLSKDEREVLNEHLFGDWIFSKRLIKLTAYGYPGDFSDLAVEEFKNLRVTYESDLIQIKGYNKDTFSNVHDVYLFSQYSGNIMTEKPVYHIQSDMEDGNIILQYAMEKESDILISLPQKCRLVRVTFDLGYDEDSYSAVDAVCFGENVYFNPDDTDTIYVDCGGLWELKRAGGKGSYSTAGKSEK